MKNFKTIIALTLVSIGGISFDSLACIPILVMALVAQTYKHVTEYEIN